MIQPLCGGSFTTTRKVILAKSNGIEFPGNLKQSSPANIKPLLDIVEVNVAAPSRRTDIWGRRLRRKYREDLPNVKEEGEAIVSARVVRNDR